MVSERSVDLGPADPGPDRSRRDETLDLLAAHGMPVTEEGRARARRVLAEADERMTPDRWRALRDRLGLTEGAARPGGASASQPAA